MGLINIKLKPTTQSVITNGTAAGVIGVTDPTQFWVGANVIVANSTSSVECVVTDYAYPHGLELKLCTGGVADLSAYTTASNATVSMSAQSLVGESRQQIGVCLGNSVQYSLAQNGSASFTAVGGVRYRVAVSGSPGAAANMAVGKAATGNDYVFFGNEEETFAFCSVGSTVTVSMFTGAAAGATFYVTILVPVYDYCC